MHSIVTHDSTLNIRSFIKYCEFVLIILTALLIPIIAFCIQIIFAIVKPHIFDGPSYAQYFSSQLRLDQHPFIRYCEFLLIILTAWLTDTHCFFCSIQISFAIVSLTIFDGATYGLKTTIVVCMWWSRIYQVVFGFLIGLAVLLMITAIFLPSRPIVLARF